MVFRIKKALYGLKKAPITWYARLEKYLATLGFAEGTMESNLYLKVKENGLQIIIVFVDILYLEVMMKKVTNLLKK